MNSQLKITYDTMGSSSYLAVAFPLAEPVVRYQLEMIVSNEISHLLPAARRQLNGETVIYYNISSKIRLSQLLERRKLTRGEFMNLAFGALKAIEEGGEYQLSETGLAMEPEYVYIEPDTCSPSFLYIPTEKPAGKGIREFLLDLIVHGKIEMSSDNLIQALLEVLNCQPVSLREIGDCLERYRAGGRKEEQKESGGKGQKEASGGGAAGDWGWPRKETEPAAAVSGPASPPAREAQAAVLGAGFGREAKDAKTEPERKKGPGKPAEEKRKKRGAVKKEAGIRQEETGFDREKAKRKFLLPQAAVMVAFAAMFSFGLFTDGEGGLAVNNLLAALLLAGVGEVILYREIYVNGPKAKKKKGQKEEKKAPAKGSVPVPEGGAALGRRPAPPAFPKMSAAPFQEKAAGNRESQKQEEGRMNQESRPLLGRTAEPVPGGAWKNPTFEPVLQDKAEPSAGGETELWDAQEEGVWLEYYENGIMSRVALNQESSLVGRLSSQVDFAVANPKVGKVHAEFLLQNGRVYVKDQNSKNGTYINRSPQRINSNTPYELKDGDVVCLADSEFILHCPRN